MTWIILRCVLASATSGQLGTWKGMTCWRSRITGQDPVLAVDVAARVERQRRGCKLRFGTVGDKMCEGTG